VERHVHKVAIAEDDRIELKTSWKMTKQCGAMSMQHLGTDTLLLGYESGCLEARKMDHDFGVKWTGYFHHPIRLLATLKKCNVNSEAVPSELEPAGDAGSGEAKPKPSTSVHEALESDFFLIVTLQSEIGNGRHATASIVHDVDSRSSCPTPC
jgi:hypothetical protein